ncbi:MFS transporter [Pseudofrankia inefficax]|uniref:Major facilitator superfamily MFS_1 n=1 Tax=Pseudofrankia inefficax (strain DSM 45817 / CECT 9037 / DDB 130130 / EuI1c) TaxID=298654 RepID=E3J5E8_PSEI1|nr:MFS transporter [Pseudofrankia inefficax]ADP81892.1 major facilitator superfamily MFS_1 [Pseudofrankia inefficax]
MSSSSAPTSRPGPIVAVLAAGGIVATLMQTLVVPLIGELPRLLGTSAGDASWVITATLLAGSAAIAAIGRLSDLLGNRRMLLACVGSLLVGSVVCALSGSLAPMVVGRALEGVGLGVVPVGISALRELVPPERLGSSIALISSSLGIGGALGLPFAAVMAEHAGWHAVFWVAAGLSAVVAALIWLLVPVLPPRATGRFDGVGAVGLGFGLVCLLLAVSKGADWGWTSGTTVGLIGGSLAVFAAWGWWELRTTDPLVNLRIAARRQVLMTNLASVVLGFALYASQLILPQLLQLPKATGYGLGQSMLAMGLWMAPSGLLMLLVAPIGGRLSQARGPRVTLIAGSLIIAAGYGSSLILLSTAWGLLIVSCVCMVGVAFAYGAMPALIVSAVPSSETGSATSFNTLSRSIGITMASAVVGVVLTQRTTLLGTRTVPSEGGFRLGLLIGCGVAVAAATVALAIPSRPGQNRTSAASVVRPGPNAIRMALSPADGGSPASPDISRRSASRTVTDEQLP